MAALRLLKRSRLSSLSPSLPSPPLSLACSLALAFALAPFLVAGDQQLAVSYLHSDEVEVYDLTRVKQDGSVAPVKTLVPSSSSLNGNSGGRGHLCLEFVRRAGPSGSKLVTHLVAGGRDGVFRVWRLATERASKIAPYLQVRREEKRRETRRSPLPCPPFDG